ncbi:hypothetical protein SynA18461_02822 [Synechococcus sp. A18-46.1]|nr:hypothetical protein SynA18461_02822 [Synechococcus sp. A18-46.1]
MADIYPVKKKYLAKLHRYGQVIFCTFFSFNPKRIISPHISQWYPYINPALFNPKIPISMKNAAS